MHPILREWLDTNNARHMSTDRNKVTGDEIRRYTVGGRMLLILLMGDEGKDGWEAFIPITTSLGVEDTIKALDVYAGRPFDALLCEGYGPEAYAAKPWKLTAYRLDFASEPFIQCPSCLPDAEELINNGVTFLKLSDVDTAQRGISRGKCANCGAGAPEGVKTE